MNQGWTAFEIPSTPGRDFEFRPPPWGAAPAAVARRGAAAAPGVDLLPLLRLEEVRLPASAVPTMTKDHEEAVS